MLPSSIAKLIEQFTRLPGIGPKTAQRLAFYLLKKPQADLENFAVILKEAKKDLRTCSTCLNLSQNDPCNICADPERDAKTLCVVAESHDLESLERTGEYNGLYFVLGGVLNHLEGIGPESLNIAQLVNRIKNNNIQEIILSLNPDLEGESTMMYLQNMLKNFVVKITKLAKGLPSGSDIEYADEVTLGSALKNRREIN